MPMWLGRRDVPMWPCALQCVIECASDLACLQRAWVSASGLLSLHCVNVQAELLHTIAVANNDRTQHRSDRERGRHGPHVHPRDHNPEDEARRVRPRRE